MQCFKKQPQNFKMIFFAPVFLLCFRSGIFYICTNSLAFLKQELKLCFRFSNQFWLKLLKHEVCDLLVHLVFAAMGSCWFHQRGWELYCRIASKRDGWGWQRDAMECFFDLKTCVSVIVRLLTFQTRNRTRKIRKHFGRPASEHFRQVLFSRLLPTISIGGACRTNMGTAHNTQVAKVLLKFMPACGKMSPSTWSVSRNATM